MASLFLYGGDRLEKQLGSGIAFRKAFVRNWALVFGNHLNSGIASMAPCRGREVKGCIAELSRSQFESIQEYEGIKLLDEVYESVDVSAFIVSDECASHSEEIPTKAFVLSRTVLLQSIQNYAPPHPSHLNAIWSNLSEHWDLSGIHLAICRAASLSEGGEVSLAIVDSWRPHSADADATDIAASFAHSHEVGTPAPSTAEWIVPAPGRVFVATYGTLRRGMRNYHVNAQGGGVLFCAGRTAGSFCLYRCRGADFPCLSLRAAAPHAHPVIVDVFEVRRPARNARQILRAG